MRNVAPKRCKSYIVIGERRNNEVADWLRVVPALCLLADVITAEESNTEVDGKLCLEWIFIIITTLRAINVVRVNSKHV